jgi:chaperonin GroEL
LLSATKVDKEKRPGRYCDGGGLVEVKEGKDRVDDAMHATRAAVEEGILPGGGVALLRSVKALGRLKAENDDQKTGIDIVRKALSTPARQIAVDAGEDGSIVGRLWWDQ